MAPTLTRAAPLTVAAALAAALAATLAALVAPAPGFAADPPHREVVRDPAYDVVRVDGGTRPAPAEPTTDVTSVLARHRHDTVVLRVRMDSVEQDAQRTLITRVDTPRGGYFVNVAYSRRAAFDGLFVETAEEGWIFGCATGTVVADEETDEVVVTVPRRCVGNPRWVRLGATVAQTWRGRGDDQAEWRDKTSAGGRRLGRG